MRDESKVKRIHVPYNFEPRDYQEPLMRAMDEGCRYGACMWHRRAGKDLVFMNILVKEALRRVGHYAYYLPTLKMCREIVWEGMDNGGRRFLDYIPRELISRKVDNVMFIRFVNGSSFQMLGTENTEVVGVNPVGVFFSECGLQGKSQWQYVQPILKANGGFALFNGTPRGENFFTDLVKKNKDPNWFTQVLTIRDTGVVGEDEVESDILNGLISRERALQEYYCSTEAGVEGSYFGRYIEEGIKAGRISADIKAIEDEYVFTVWDLGIDNNMAVWFVQVCVEEGRKSLRFVDYYEKNNEGYEHFVEVMREKAVANHWTYGGHFAPWDVAKRESNGLTVQKNAEKYGLYFQRVPKGAVRDRIEVGRRLFGRCYFDAEKCSYGLKMLKGYHAKKIERMSEEGRPVFTEKPEHDRHSDGADAWTYSMVAWEAGLLVPDKFMGSLGERTAVHFDENYLEMEEKELNPAMSYEEKGVMGGRYDDKKYERRNYLL